MEIVKNRYNDDRVIEKVSPTRLRIMGDSLIYRESTDENGNLLLVLCNNQSLARILLNSFLNVSRGVGGSS